jgi:perosamine synthetase
VDVDAVQALAARHGLNVIYDAAQSHLARWRGQGIGAFGNAVTYSFYATKNLATGEGGMVTCNDEALARKIKSLRSHGETDKYLHERVGYNYRMNDITGAIGCSRLDRLAAQTHRRQELAARLDRIVGEIDGLTPPTTTPGGEAVFHLYVVKLDPSRFTCTRDEFCHALKSEGVPTAVHYPRSLTRQPAFAEFATYHPPVSDSLSKRVFALPIHQDLSEDHVRIIREALNKVAAAYRV